MRYQAFHICRLIMFLAIGLIGCSETTVSSGPNGEVKWSASVEKDSISGDDTILLRGLLNGRPVTIDQVESLRVFSVTLFDRENSKIITHEDVTATIENGAVCILVDKPDERDVGIVDCFLSIRLKSPDYRNYGHIDGMFRSQIELEQVDSPIK